MSEWLHTGLSRHGLEVVLMETRYVRAALEASLVKTDCRDACGIAHLQRMGWFRPVHVKTASLRERRVLLGARDTLVRRVRDLDNSSKGLLRGFDLRPPPSACAVERCRSPAHHRASHAHGGDRSDLGRPRPARRGARSPRVPDPRPALLHSFLALPLYDSVPDAKTSVSSASS
jgi:transposase